MRKDPRYSIFAARAVFDERLNHLDVRVLAALGSETDRQGWCSPSQTELANSIDASRSAVIASMKRLEACGYVQVVPQTSEGRGRTVNMYRVLTDMNAPDAVASAVPVPMSNKTTGADVQEMDIGPVQKNDIGLPVSKETTGADVQKNDVYILEPVINPQLPSVITPKGATARGVRLPADWKPRPEEISFGTSNGLTADEVAGCAEHFRDHFESSTKSNARKSNWDQAFRNWLRTAISDAKRGRRPVPAKVMADGSRPGDWSPERRMQHFRETGEWKERWGPKPDASPSTDLFAVSASIGRG